jgi:hypothetical protein
VRELIEQLSGFVSSLAEEKPKKTAPSTTGKAKWMHALSKMKHRKPSKLGYRHMPKKVGRAKKDAPGAMDHDGKVSLGHVRDSIEDMRALLIHLDEIMKGPHKMGPSSSSRFKGLKAFKKHKMRGGGAAGPAFHKRYQRKFAKRAQGMGAGGF